MPNTILISPYGALTKIKICAAVAFRAVKLYILDKQVLTNYFQQSVYKRIFRVLEGGRFRGTEAGLFLQPVGLKRDTFECKG